VRVRGETVRILRLRGIKLNIDTEKTWNESVCLLNQKYFRRLIRRPYGFFWPNHFKRKIWCKRIFRQLILIIYHFTFLLDSGKCYYSQLSSSFTCSPNFTPCSLTNENVFNFTLDQLEHYFVLNPVSISFPHTSSKRRNPLIFYMMKELHYPPSHYIWHNSC
jgi:hypothetical protein